MAQVIFYEKPGCSGNARQQALLRAAGHRVETRDLLTAPWTASSLLAFLAPLAVPEWFNRAAPAVKSGALDPAGLDRETALALLLAQPLLIRRPLLQVGEERRVGFQRDAIAAWIGLEGVPEAAPEADVGEGCPKGEAQRPCPPPRA